MTVCHCAVASFAQGVPLYRHIADLAGNPKVIMPVPVSHLSSDFV